MIDAIDEAVQKQRRDYEALIQSERHNISCRTSQMNFHIALVNILKVSDKHNLVPLTKKYAQNCYERNYELLRHSKT